MVVLHDLLDQLSASSIAGVYIPHGAATHHGVSSLRSDNTFSDTNTHGKFSGEIINSDRDIKFAGELTESGLNSDSKFGNKLIDSAVESAGKLGSKFSSIIDAASNYESQDNRSGFVSSSSSSSRVIGSSVVSSKIKSLLNTPRLMSLFEAEIPAQLNAFPSATFLPSPTTSPHHTTTRMCGGLAGESGDCILSPSHSSHSFPSVEEASSWSAEQICGVLIVSLIVPFILVSNLLVIASVVKFKRLQMPTNYFIVSLAAVDVFVALVTPFVIAVEVLPGQVPDMMLCLSPNRILMTACGVSLLTLAAIAYDRHTALVSPLKYVSVMTRRRIAVLVAFTWLYSACIVWAPLPLGWYSDTELEETVKAESWKHPEKGLREDDTGSAGDSSSPGGSETTVSSTTATSASVQPQQLHQHCSFKLLHDNAHILFLSAIFGPACVAITVCYFRIYTVARHHARAIAAVESSVHHNLRIRFMMKDAKYAKTLALVIGVFLLLWMPYLVCLLAEVMTDVHVSAWTWNYLTLLAVLNSGLNPWIYAYKNNEFRTAFRKILNNCCRLGCLRSCRDNKDSRRSSALSEVNTIATNNTLNYLTTSTTISSLPRSRQGSGPPGRLSDASCVLTVPEEPSGGRTDDESKDCVDTKTAATNSTNYSGSLCPRRTSTTGCLRNLDSTNKQSESVSVDLNRDFLHRHASTTIPVTPTHCSSNCDKFFHRRTSLIGEKLRTNFVSGDSRGIISDLLNRYLHHSLLEARNSSSTDSDEHEHGDGHSEHSEGSLDTVATHDSEMNVERSS